MLVYSVVPSRIDTSDGTRRNVFEDSLLSKHRYLCLRLLFVDELVYDLRHFHCGSELLLDVHLHYFQPNCTGSHTQ